MTVLSWDTASSSNDTDQATPMASPCSTHEPIHSASTTDIHGSTPRRSRSLLQPFYYNDEQRAASVNVPSFLFRRDAQPDATFRRHHSARRHDNKSEARAQERGPRTRHHLSRAILPGLRKLLPPSWSASKKTNASERRRPPPPLAPPPLPSSTRTNGAAGPAVARRIVHLAIKPPLDKGKSGEKRLCSNKVENFHQALDNALVDSHIRDFCKRTLSVENVAFVRQVRELEMASKSGGMSTSERRHRVTLVAATFLRPGCPTEVNVKGSTRSAALAAVTAAEQGAEDVGFFAGKGDTEAVAAAQAVQAATEALLDLAREVHSVILHDIWPRFLESPEFETLMTFTEMREVGFRDLDGSEVVPPRASSSLSIRSRAGMRERARARKAQAALVSVTNSSASVSNASRDGIGSQLDVASSAAPVRRYSYRGSGYGYSHHSGGGRSGRETGFAGPRDTKNLSMWTWVRGGRGGTVNIVARSPAAEVDAASTRSLQSKKNLGLGANIGLGLVGHPAMSARLSGDNIPTGRTPPQAQALEPEPDPEPEPESQLKSELERAAEKATGTDKDVGTKSGAGTPQHGRSLSQAFATGKAITGQLGTVAGRRKLDRALSRSFANSGAAIAEHLSSTPGGKILLDVSHVSRFFAQGGNGGAAGSASAVSSGEEIEDADRRHDEAGGVAREGSKLRRFFPSASASSLSSSSSSSQHHLTDSSFLENGQPAARNRKPGKSWPRGPKGKAPWQTGAWQPAGSKP